jgi:peroxiredoxin
MLKSQAPAAGGGPSGGVPAGTPAPDGVGVTMSRAATAGEYDTSVMTFVPWEDASVIRPLPAGARMPADTRVLTVDGRPFDLSAAVAGKPTVLIFYRGGWCPYCNAHLRELQKSVGALRQMGYQLLAVSADTPEALRERNGGYMVTPGAFVIDRHGTIRFVYANNNYAVRVSQDALLLAARAALD